MQAPQGNLKTNYITKSNEIEANGTINETISSKFDREVFRQRPMLSNEIKIVNEELQSMGLYNNMGL